MTDKKEQDKERHRHLVFSAPIPQYNVSSWNHFQQYESWTQQNLPAKLDMKAAPIKGQNSSNNSKIPPITVKLLP